MSMLTYVRASRGTSSAMPFRADVVELAHRHHPVAVVGRVLDFCLDAPQATDSDLGKAQHMRHRSDVAERVGVGEAEIVDERRIVDVGIEVDDVQRLLVLVSLDDRVGDGVVTAEHHRQCPLGEDRFGEIGRIVERALHVGGPYVDIPDVRDGLVGHFVGEVRATGVRVVEPGVGRREAQRVLANRARTHARAREEGRAFVEGDPVDRDVGVEGVEICLDGRAQERREVDERAVELDSRPSAARCHGGSPAGGRDFFRQALPIRPVYASEPLTCSTVRLKVETVSRTPSGNPPAATRPMQPGVQPSFRIVEGGVIHRDVSGLVALARDSVPPPLRPIRS